jgi:hypothetical protein
MAGRRVRNAKLVHWQDLAWTAQPHIGQLSDAGTRVYDRNTGQLSDAGTRVYDRNIGQLSDAGTRVYDRNIGPTMGRMAGGGRTGEAIAWRGVMLTQQPAKPPGAATAPGKRSCNIEPHSYIVLN